MIPYFLKKNTCHYVSVFEMIIVYKNGLINHLKFMLTPKANQRNKRSQILLQFFVLIDIFMNNFTILL
jgi:hypothetical protein